MKRSFKVAMAGGAIFALAIMVGQGCAMTQKRLYDHTRASVLYMYEPTERRGGGTGFVVETENGNTYTLTNAHICRMTNLNHVAVTDGEREPLNLQVLAIAQNTDLCILPAYPGIEPLKLAEGRNMFEHINIVGHPLLLPVSIAGGYINGRRSIQLMGEPDPNTGACRDFDGLGTQATPALFGDATDIAALLAGCVKEIDADWSDAKTFPGNSGSPVVNDKGEVVGVLFAGNAENFSFIIPLDKIKEFLKGY